MSHALETKRYAVESADGVFQLFISHHNDGLFHAGVFYYDRSFADTGKLTALSFDMKSFVDTTEESVLRAATEWIKSEFGPDSVVKLM